ncbi:UNVERIFIED_ORG: hypothetical protein M2420_001380 [Stenotrophomonas maltophilia]
MTESAQADAEHPILKSKPHRVLAALICSSRFATLWLDLTLLASFSVLLA